jgi:ESCRT-II complex subunit VPS36
MEHFSPAPLTIVGRPIHMDEEVEIKNFEDVSILLQQQKHPVGDIFPPSSIVLTNIRLIVIPPKSQSSHNTGWALKLDSVLRFEDCKKLLGTSTRISVFMIDNRREIGMKFHKDDKLEFMETFSKVLTKKSWESISLNCTKAIQSTTGETFSVKNAGVGGLIRRQERALQSVDNLTKSALSDLESLMISAKEVISVVQRYASLAASNADECHSETSSVIAGEVTEMESIMQNIGIVSPVTRYSAGRAYHQLLARQVADILLSQSRLSRVGGMISLTDLYCLVNRARGTELVSPEDLLKAVELTGNMELGVFLRTFASGVKVVQLQTHSDAALGQEILNAFTNNPEYMRTGLQISQIARLFHISLAVAKEVLFYEEQKLNLCRDESVQGLSFFPNKYFKE